MKVRPATSLDFETITRWLAAAHLPVADLATDDMSDFLLAEGEDGPAGTIGHQRFGRVALLRSLVVAPRAQGGGTGRQLVAALETAVASRGVNELWLLTTDAEAYFSKLGFTATSRDDAPKRIRQTTEFAKLCPADAVVMHKRL